MSRVYRVKDSQDQVFSRFRFVPYEELADVLRKDGTAFLEDNPDRHLKRGTVWKAARKLSEMVGKRVTYRAVTVRLGDEKNGQMDAMNGYLFEVEG